MQIFRLFFSIFLIFSFISCEKEVINNQNNKELEARLTDDIKRQALTVEEAIDIEPGYWITVKGYIVAAAESSIKNADFRKPFAGKTAILLSDEPADGTDEQVFSNLMPISLSDAGKGISSSFNLQDHAELWNSFVYIHGIRKQYLSAPGIKEVTNIWIDSNHNPNNDEDTPGPNTDNPNEDDNPPIDDNGDNYDNVLTVAQAINAPIDKVIRVNGYIVATTSKSMNNVKFENIHENFTAIVLADAPDTKEKEKLFPVGVEKSLREELIATYGAEIKNLRVTVIGNKDTYLGQPGIKKTLAIKVTP
ncbi:hypothetical protein SAMN02910409_1025 [Prevotellaceae bacterium HUN156]|nr:hypothetical protein SAMN02910409_1025 [Prevotellaceae bacterium HUN156]